MSKKFTTLRIYKENKEWLDEITSQLSYNETKRITNPEVIRRITNIPNLFDVLNKDSLFNKRGKKK